MIRRADTASYNFKPNDKKSTKKVKKKTQIDSDRQRQGGMRKHGEI